MTTPMVGERVDVGVATMRGLSQEFRGTLEAAIPINRLIIDDSTKPLGKARENIIRQVTTDRFAFIDDDVFLPRNWYDTIMRYWEDEIGWLEGWAIPTRPDWYNRWCLHRFREARNELVTKRGFTLDTIIQTNLVKDWHSPEDLDFYEDQALTQHVLAKGKKVLRVSVASEHRIGYDIFEQTRKSILQSKMTRKQKWSWAGVAALSGMKTFDPEIVFNATKLAFVWLTA